MILMSVITYEGLFASFKKGLRNGNWGKLNFLDEALFRASLWYAKHRGSIVNAALVKKPLALVERLKETKGMRIFKKGFKKAVEILAERSQLHLLARDGEVKNGNFFLWDYGHVEKQEICPANTYRSERN